MLSINASTVLHTEKFDVDQLETHPRLPVCIGRYFFKRATSVRLTTPSFDLTKQRRIFIIEQRNIQVENAEISSKDGVPENDAMDCKSVDEGAIGAIIAGKSVLIALCHVEWLNNIGKHDDCAIKRVAEPTFNVK